MKINEIKQPLKEVQVNAIGDMVEPGTVPGYKIFNNCSIWPGGAMSIVQLVNEPEIKVDSKAMLAVVVTSKSTVAVSKAVLDAADKTALQDTKYAGAPSPQPPAADKPKIPEGVTPATTEPSGEYKNVPMLVDVMVVVPKKKGEEWLRDKYTHAHRWDVRISGSPLSTAVVASMDGEGDENKPPLAVGKQLVYVTRNASKNDPTKFFYSLSLSAEGKKGSGFKQDVEALVVSGIVSNPTIPMAEWQAAAKKAMEVYYNLKGGSK